MHNRKNRKSSQIIIGADLVPIGRNLKDFSQGEIEHSIDSQILNIIKDADLKLFNLEAPVTRSSEKLLKSGPNICINPDCLKGIEQLKPTILSLANNHIMDYGKEGLLDTLTYLKKLGIETVGADTNRLMASQPRIFDVNGQRIGIYSCAEHEYSIATELEPGASPYDPLESFDIVYSLKQECQYVIVLFHGGKEHYNYPTLELQRICRKFAEKGADLIISQHSHCIGCCEKFSDATIVYGQGNFLFDLSDDPHWLTGMLVSLEIETKRIEYIPFIKRDGFIEHPQKQEAENIIKEFFERSSMILDRDRLKNKQIEEANKMGAYYLRILHGSHLLIKVIDKLLDSKIIKLLYSKKAILSLLNIIRCETHREMLVTYLEELLKARSK